MIRPANTHDLMGNYARQLDEVKLQLCGALRKPKDCQETASRLAFDAAKLIAELRQENEKLREAL